jgi:hypothetical protein
MLSSSLALPIELVPTREYIGSDSQFKSQSGLSNRNDTAPEISVSYGGIVFT